VIRHICGFVLFGIAALYVHDRRQTAHTILRNYPVIGYFRYFAETLGEYMRQYQYLPDWAERPFNRLERAWVYRSAKGVSNLRSFGSENVPAFVFRNAAFPVLDEEKRPYPGKQIGIAEGPGACRHPYVARSFFNIVHLFSSQALRERRLSRASRAAEKMLGRQREGTLCRKTPTENLGPIVSLRCAERLFPGLCVEPLNTGNHPPLSRSFFRRGIGSRQECVDAVRRPPSPPGHSPTRLTCLGPIGT